MKRTHVPFVVWLIAAALMPAVVSAQSGGEGGPQPADVRRPYRGIFNGLSTPNSPQSLVFSGALYGAYDDNVLNGLTQQIGRNWWLQESGHYVGATAGLDYLFTRNGSRVDFGANAGAHGRYYRSEELSSFLPEYRAGADLAVAMTKSTQLRLGHDVLYSHSYRFFALSPFEDAQVAEGLIVSDPALDLLRLAAVRNSSDVTVSQELGRHASFSVGYHLRAVNFRDDDVPDEDEPDLRDGQLRDYTTQAGTARIDYNRPFTAHATLNLGYGIRVSDSEQGTGEPRAVHDIRAGVSYSRALSISRRTFFSFATGSAAAVSDDLSEPEAGRQTHFRLTGNANLRHEIGRTWTASAGYFRGFDFREGYNEPFFTEGATAGLGGLITRRLSFSAVGTWSLSTLQREGRTGQDSFTATVQSTYALSRFLALFANYVYYKYDFEEDVPLDPRFPRALDRQGIRVGITTSIPIIR